MDSLNQTHLKALIREQSGPCLSVFTQTQRGGSEQNLIRFRHQLDDGEKQLRAVGLSEEEAARALKAPRAVVKDVDYWKNMSDGLATFIQGNSCQMYRVPLKFDNEVFAARHVLIKPLIPWFEEGGRFYVLAISQNHVRLLEGNLFGVRPIRMSEAPSNKEEALRTHDRDEVLNVHTHPGAAGRLMEKMFHGHGVGIDDEKAELTKYFQQIDHALCRTLAENHAPLILATVEYLGAMYRKISKYPRVLEVGVWGNPDRINDNELYHKAFPLAAPFLHERRDRALVHHQQFVGSGRTTHTISEILPAAFRGELETLLLAHGGSAWGRFDSAAGSIEEHANRMPGDDELTNLAAVYMLRHGRHVFSVAPDSTFDGAPMAGIYFLPMDHHGKSRR